MGPSAPNLHQSTALSGLLTRVFLSSLSHVDPTRDLLPVITTWVTTMSRTSTRSLLRLRLHRSLWSRSSLPLRMVSHSIGIPRSWGPTCPPIRYKLAYTRAASTHPWSRLSISSSQFCTHHVQLRRPIHYDIFASFSTIIGNISVVLLHHHFI